MDKILHSSESNEWETPQLLFDILDSNIHFKLDPCATKDNHKCEKYYTVEDDGLSKHWKGPVFMNPPYGREIGKWVKKAYETSLPDLFHDKARVVGLIPARPDTKYWFNYIFLKAWVIFLKGRLKFSNPGVGECIGAPFPSALVFWGDFKKVDIYDISFDLNICGDYENAVVVTVAVN